MAVPSPKAPLAGRPPFATDDDDAIFDVPPAPRPPRQRVVQNADNRESTYNAYDQYFQNPRDSSAALGVGLGLMGEQSDSDDDDDDDVRRPVPTVAGGKNRVLYEAATRRTPEHSVPTPVSGSRTFPSDIKRQRSPSPPGYTPQAAPANAYEKPSPGPGMSIRVPPPTSQDSQQPPPQPLRSMARSPMPAPVPQHAHLSPARPVPAFLIPGAPSTPVPASPAPSSTTFHSYPASPHPLPPSSPITPLFAAPPAALHSTSKVSFSSEEKAPIMRGNSEDSLLVRTRPTKDAGRAHGDDFWRRFSMVAHQAEDKRHSAGNSSWLTKTQAGARRMSLWVWIIGIIVLLAIGGGVALGIKGNQNKPGHQDPVAIGGGANQSMDSPTTTPVVAAPHPKHDPSTPQPNSATLGARAAPELVMKRNDASTIPRPTALHILHKRHRDKHNQRMRA